MTRRRRCSDGPPDEIVGHPSLDFRASRRSRPPRSRAGWTCSRAQGSSFGARLRYHRSDGNVDLARAHESQSAQRSERAMACLRKLSTSATRWRRTKPFGSPRTTACDAFAETVPLGLLHLDRHGKHALRERPALRDPRSPLGRTTSHCRSRTSSCETARTSSVRSAMLMIDGNGPRPRRCRQGPGAVVANRLLSSPDSAP